MNDESGSGDKWMVRRLGSSLMHKILPHICYEKEFTGFFSIILSKTYILIFNVWMPTVHCEYYKDQSDIDPSLREFMVW